MKFAENDFLKYFDPFVDEWMLMRFGPLVQIQRWRSRKNSNFDPILIQFQITQRYILIQFLFESGSKTRIGRTGSKIEILENVTIFEKNAVNLNFELFKVYQQVASMLVTGVGD